MTVAPTVFMALGLITFPTGRHRAKTASGQVKPFEPEMNFGASLRMSAESNLGWEGGKVTRESG